MRYPVSIISNELIINPMSHFQRSSKISADSPEDSIFTLDTIDHLFRAFLATDQMSTRKEESLNFFFPALPAGHRVA